MPSNGQEEVPCAASLNAPRMAPTKVYLPTPTWLENDLNLKRCLTRLHTNVNSGRLFKSEVDPTVVYPCKPFPSNPLTTPPVVDPSTVGMGLSPPSTKHDSDATLPQYHLSISPTRLVPESLGPNEVLFPVSSFLQCKPGPVQ